MKNPDFKFQENSESGFDRRFGRFLYRNLSRLRLSFRLILPDAIWKDYGTFHLKFKIPETMIKAVNPLKSESGC